MAEENFLTETLSGALSVNPFYMGMRMLDARTPAPAPAPIPAANVPAGKYSTLPSILYNTLGVLPKGYTAVTPELGAEGRFGVPRDSTLANLFALNPGNAWVVQTPQEEMPLPQAAPAPTPTPGPMGMFVPSVSGPGGAAPQATGVDYTQLAALLGGEVTPEEAPGKMDFLLNALAQTGYNPNMGMGENLLQLGLASLASGPQARAAERQVGKETAAVQAEQQKQTLDLLMKQLAADAATEQFNIKTQLDFAENQRQAGQNLRPMVAGDGVVLFPQPTAGGTNWIPQQVGTPGGSSKAAQDAQTAKILALYLGSEQLSPMVNELLGSPGMNQLSMMDSTARQVLLQQLQMANPEVYNYAVQQVQGQ
jgi:hypothetical protein